ncbi:mitochondrial hypoxia responsive domain-containing protein [Xylaria venustula]|nr:mitochondrial hypoxia responsive domain-containing protein [Xylaria venustula]
MSQRTQHKIIGLSFAILQIPYSVIMSDRPLPSSFDEDKDYQETGFQKIARKLREEPLIPLGAGLTCLALYNAWRAMRRGDHAQVQRMFRARIGAQAFTVIAIVAGGTYYGADREKRKELIKLEAQKRADERNQKWLHELEVRDEEDKQLQAAIRRKRERLEQKRVQEKQGDDSATPATVTDLEGKANSDNTTGGGSSVMGALSNAGGWFGTKKKEPADEANSDTEAQKK